jgi:pimeloyl-ACP methyl ester carboxylesterase
VRGEFVDCDGVRLHCHAAGTRGRGAPVLLLHGAFASSHLWEEVVPRLPAGHRVLLVDLAGHGRSDSPAPSPPTVARHAAWVGALLRVLGVERATVVGHDLGAAVAATLAHTHPSTVARVVAVAPRLLDAPHAPPLRRVALAAPLLRRLPPGWLASALHAALLPGFVHRAQGARTLDQHLLPFRTREGRRAAAAQLAALRRWAPVPLPLPCPLPRVAGGADRPGRRTAARVAAAATAAGAPPVAVHTVHGSAAMVPLEAPEALATVIAEVLTEEITAVVAEERAPAPALEQGVTPAAPRAEAM